MLRRRLGAVISRLPCSRLSICLALKTAPWGPLNNSTREAEMWEAGPALCAELVFLVVFGLGKWKMCPFIVLGEAYPGSEVSFRFLLWSMDDYLKNYEGTQLLFKHLCTEKRRADYGRCHRLDNPSLNTREQTAENVAWMVLMCHVALHSTA